MANATFNLCQLYDAFKALEDAFGSFADMLYAVWCAGVDCDQTISADQRAVDDVLWLEDIFENPMGGGKDQCFTSPQMIAWEEFLRQVTAYVEHTPGVVTALEATLKRAGLKKIEFLTRRDRRERKQVKG